MAMLLPHQIARLQEIIASADQVQGNEVIEAAIREANSVRNDQIRTEAEAHEYWEPDDTEREEGLL